MDTNASLHPVSATASPVENADSRFPTLEVMEVSDAVALALESAIASEAVIASAIRKARAAGIDAAVAPDLYATGDSICTSERLKRALAQVQSYATEMATADVLVQAFEAVARDLCDDIEVPPRRRIM